MKLRSRKEQAEGMVVIVADMTVAYNLIRETFRSRATLDRANLRILVEYLEGPFSRMENRWEFHPVQDKLCDVKFFITYEFRSRMLGMLMGAMFDTAFRRFAVAFEQRADVVYGRKTHSRYGSVARRVRGFALRRDRAASGTPAKQTVSALRRGR